MEQDTWLRTKKPGFKSLRAFQVLRARAAKWIGHQPPKLAIREFESHRAFRRADATGSMRARLA